MDSNGNRLKDAEGNLKTLRHKFAVYCDDICAGADSLDELYELFEALICCCKRVGIQVKASKTKLVWRKSRSTTTPSQGKEHSLRMRIFAPLRI